MAELATLARPYAEAMFKATAGADRKALSEQLATLVALTFGLSANCSSCASARPRPAPPPHRLRLRP